MWLEKMGRCGGSRRIGEQRRTIASVASWKMPKMQQARDHFADGSGSAAWLAWVARGTTRRWRRSTFGIQSRRAFGRDWSYLMTEVPALARSLENAPRVAGLL